MTIINYVIVCVIVCDIVNRFDFDQDRKFACIHEFACSLYDVIDDVVGCYDGNH